MKRLGFTLAAVMLATLVVTADPVNATTSTGPYYATPSWDQKLDCTTAANCPRFIVLSNWNSEAVLDRETGLVWEQSLNSTDRGGTWRHGQIHCNQLEKGGRLGWRLPTVQELASLVDPTSPAPHLPAGHPFGSPFDVSSTFYWSATTDSSDTGFAWIVNFTDGNVANLLKLNPAGIWCVRGGHGVDPQ